MPTNTHGKKPRTRKGRPALSESEFNKRRAEIAAVALKLFREEGYPSVSMRRLGKEVGLTPMALYRYFPSKLDILSTLWAHILELAFARVSAAVSDASSSSERLERASLAYVDYWFDNVEHYHLVFMNAGVTNTDVTSFVSQQNVLETYEVFFANVAQSRAIARTDPDVKKATDGLVCHLHGIMHSLITMQGYAWSDRDALVRSAVANAIGGMSKGGIGHSTSEP